MSLLNKRKKLKQPSKSGMIDGIPVDKRFMVINIGCLECEDRTVIVGIYSKLSVARTVATQQSYSGTAIFNLDTLKEVEQ